MFNDAAEGTAESPARAVAARHRRPGASDSLSRQRGHPAFALAPAVVAIVLSMLLFCCDNTSNDAQTPQKSDAAATEATGPNWTQHGDSVVAASPSPANNAALAEAIEHARSTVDDARNRWTHADAEDRSNWAVKWAAPLSNGAVEYLWVRPEHWSKFRIEGVLLNEPVHELVSGAVRGDRVSFPAEQLVDWVHIIRSGEFETREGGFTVDVLAGRSDQPSRDPINK